MAQDIYRSRRNALAIITSGAFGDPICSFAYRYDRSIPERAGTKTAKAIKEIGMRKTNA